MDNIYLSLTPTSYLIIYFDTDLNIRYNTFTLCSNSLILNIIMLPFATELNELRYYINQAITVQNSFAFYFNRALVKILWFIYLSSKSFFLIHKYMCVVNDKKYINNKFTRALLLS